MRGGRVVSTTRLAPFTLAHAALLLYVIIIYDLICKQQISVDRFVFGKRF